jgi:ABC-type nitrate/sulfonate/bicarbonate transport system substrate-binding protein
MWVLQAQFAGYVLARRELPELELIPWAPGRGPARTEVAEDRAEFGVASPAQLLVAPEEAQRCVFVGLFMGKSPIVLAGLRSRVGAELSDLEGGRVGVWDGEDLEIRAMLLANGLDLGRITFVPLGDDVTVLLRGEVDLMQATTYEEVPALIREGADPGELVLHRPGTWGVDVAKDGLVVRRDVLQRDPNVVDAVVGAAVRGWRDTLADRDRATDEVCRLAPELDPGWQRRQLEQIAGLFDSTSALGLPSRAEVARAVRVHRAVGHLVTEADVLVDEGPWRRAGA